jgi:glycerophosphoryl diester phosphodiesterase
VNSGTRRCDDTEVTSAPPSPLRRSVTGRVLIVAHRGLSAEEPENTMRSFRRAAEVGCDLIELDVHLSHDDIPVVIHDETLERTTNGSGRVADHTWAQLQALDAGRGERIPALEDVIAWAVKGSIALSVELKQPTPTLGLAPYEAIAERVVDVGRGGATSPVRVIHSFDHPTVLRVRELWPEATTGVSYGGGRLMDPLELGLAAKASGIHPWWAWVSGEVTSAAHAAGMHVHAWGAAWPPKRDEVEALVRAGVDSLDANDPRRLRAILEAIPTTTSP